MNGVILVNKPLGKTSHDIVYIIRRITRIKKVGHTGTLDPMAEGVLPICIGNATKAADMLTNHDKAYRAQLVLGMTTDTQDAEGEILTECGVSCSADEIKSAVLSFVGDIEQIPPMYSAIKLDGKKLYELAREGKTVERKARRVTIHSIEIVELDMENYTITIDVSCSKGTYIRSLCEDIGMKLGVGAYMNTLVRTKSGNFDISECSTVAELREMGEGIADKLIPTDKLFSEYKRLELNEKQSALVTNGVRLNFSGLKESECYRLYEKNGKFLCISKYINGQLVLEKAFWA